jgi:hypothetical protein
MNEIKECPVCYDEISSTTNNCITSCGHAFCLSCMLKCIQTNNTCPCCRTSLIEKTKIEYDSDTDSNISNYDSESGMSSDYGDWLRSHRARREQRRLEDDEISIWSDIDDDIDDDVIEDEVVEDEVVEDVNMDVDVNMDMCVDMSNYYEDEDVVEEDVVDEDVVEEDVVEEDVVEEDVVEEDVVEEDVVEEDVVEEDVVYMDVDVDVDMDMCVDMSNYYDNYNNYNNDDDYYDYNVSEINVEWLMTMCS